MRKIGEIIFVVVVIILSLVLTIISFIPTGEVIEVESSSTSNYITITVKGEINVDSVDIKIPKGQTYRYILDSISTYLNDYSVIDLDLTKRYFESTTIEILSNDSNNLNTSTKKDDDIISTSPSTTTATTGKININEASYYELTSIYGIGEKRANKILDVVQEKKIESFEELQKLLGVSNEVIERIKEQAIL